MCFMVIVFTTRYIANGIVNMLARLKGHYNFVMLVSSTVVVSTRLVLAKNAFE